ncbi:hypothetical protein R1sor_024796 [Riccia sorocarpa]|uniref:FAD-binding domain-containing protein n=1 Tax=Riccia sorocarpa TaxID=122646 RepID=A0ABD3GRH2_9MARC
MHSLLTGVRVWNMRGELLKGFELDECPGGRKILVQTLASILPKETIRFDSRIVSIERESESGPFQLTLSSGSVIRSKVLIGADGVNSVVAKWMGLAPARYAGYMGIRGLAEYREGHSHEFGSHSTLASELMRNTLIRDGEGGNDGSSQGLPRTTAGCVGPHSDGDAIQGTDHGSMESAGRVSPVVQSCVTLAGDAFHPMTPNLGQGGCCAMEDSIALARTLGPVLVQGGNPNATVITEALEEYAAERNRRTLAVTVKSFILGYLMMIAFRPFVYFRDNYLMPKFVSPTTYLTQTMYDPGQLPV